MFKIVQVINPPKWDYDTKKVGIYCRVSSNASGQLHSLADQTSGLTQYAYKQPLMVVADIFIDVASGLNVIKRPEFQRMLQTAQTGKINYVLTKAVSRFGRSTEDVLIATRALKECDVEVCFQDNNFSSFNPEAKELIALYCSVAEGENKFHSADVR